MHPVIFIILTRNWGSVGLRILTRSYSVVKLESEHKSVLLQTRCSSHSCLPQEGGNYLSLKAIKSLSFQVRAKIPLLSLVMVNVQEINTLPRTMGKPMPRWQGKLLKGASRGPPGTAAHHPLGCLILFGTVTTFAYPLLLCFKFSFLSISHEGIAHPSGSGQWHWSWQNPPTSSCPQLQSCLSLTHCSSLWTWASFGLALALVFMSWVAWVSPVTFLGLPSSMN